MKDSMIKNVIASRILHCQREGQHTEVIVRLGLPEQEEDYFICQYEITIHAESEAYSIAGKDSIQVLQLAMFMAGSTLHSMEGTSNWTWDGEPLLSLPTSLDQPLRGY